jgi:hypothetical protein
LETISRRALPQAIFTFGKQGMVGFGQIIFFKFCYLIHVEPELRGKSQSQVKSSQSHDFDFELAF